MAERLSEKYRNYLAPEAVVWINGRKLSERQVYFTELTVEQSLDAASSFSFTVSDAIDMEFEPRHADLFRFGDLVEIHIGYADSASPKGELSLLFRGVITAVNWNFGEERYLDISVEGQDHSFLLMKHKHEQPGSGEASWNDRLASEIVEEIMAGRYRSVFQRVVVDATSIRYPQTRHQEENDYLFIRSLAEKVGYEFFADSSGLYFRAPSEQESALTLRYGQEILGFAPELNADRQVTRVRVVGTELDAQKQQIVGEAEAEAPSDAASEAIGTGSAAEVASIQRLLRNVESITYEVKVPVRSKEEADQRAQILLESLGSSLFKGEVRSVGIPELKPGTTITLEGMGTRFSRDYYVEKVRHLFNDQGYETVANVRGSVLAFATKS